MKSLALCGALEHFGFRAPSLTEFGSHRIWNDLTAFENWFIDQRGGFLSIVGHGLTGNRLLQPVYSDTSDEEDEIELQTFSRSSPDGSEEQTGKSAVAETSFVSPTPRAIITPFEGAKGGISMSSMASQLPSIDIFSPRPRTSKAVKRKCLDLPKPIPLPVPGPSTEVPKILKDLAQKSRELPSISGPTLPAKIKRTVTVPMLKAKLGTLPIGNLEKQKKAIEQFTSAATPRVTRQSVRRIVTKSPLTYRSRSPSPSETESAME